MDTTNLSRYLDPEELERAKAAGIYHLKTAEQPASSSRPRRSSKELGAGTSRTVTRPPVVDPAEAESTGAGVAAYALDHGSAERLWELSVATLS